MAVLGLFMGIYVEARAELLLLLDARQPGTSPGTQWEDLSGNNQPFVSNGNPVHSSRKGIYSFNYDAQFTGNVADESLYDFDTSQGTGAIPFTLVCYASVNGDRSLEGMVNKLASSQSFGWSGGLSQNEFSFNNVFAELRTNNNNVRTIVRTPGSTADSEPNSLNDIGITARVLNLYVIHFSGVGQGG